MESDTVFKTTWSIGHLAGGFSGAVSASGTTCLKPRAPKSSEISELIKPSVILFFNKSILKEWVGGSGAGLFVDMGSDHALMVMFRVENGCGKMVSGKTGSAGYDRFLKRGWGCALHPGQRGVRAKSAALSAFSAVQSAGRFFRRGLMGAGLVSPGLRVWSGLDGNGTPGFHISLIKESDFPGKTVGRKVPLIHATGGAFCFDLFLPAAYSVSGLGLLCAGGELKVVPPCGIRLWHKRLIWFFHFSGIWRVYDNDGGAAGRIPVGRCCVAVPGDGKRRKKNVEW